MHSTFLSICLHEYFKWFLHFKSGGKSFFFFFLFVRFRLPFLSVGFWLLCVCNSKLNFFLSCTSCSDFISFTILLNFLLLLTFFFLSIGGDYFLAIQMVSVQYVQFKCWIFIVDWRRFSAICFMHFSSDLLQQIASIRLCAPAREHQGEHHSAPASYTLKYTFIQLQMASFSSNCLTITSASRSKNNAWIKWRDKFVVNFMTTNKNK